MRSPTDGTFTQQRQSFRSFRNAPRKGALTTLLVAITMSIEILTYDCPESLRSLRKVRRRPITKATKVKMRNHCESTLLFIGLLATIGSFIACGQQVIAVAQSLEIPQLSTESSSESTEPQKSQYNSVQVDSKCAFDERKTVQTVKNQKGKVVLIGGIYAIATEGNNSTRLGPCNLPDALKTEGKEILFSGEVKEIYPYERWAATPFKITTVQLVASDKSTPARSSIQNLPNGSYKFCSEPPSTTLGKDPQAAHCFLFGKRGNRLVGNFYDARTLGEVSVCVSGTLGNNTVRGEALESVGDIGRQNTPPNSNGNQLVNWDKQGYLKVARAIQVGTPNVGGGRPIRYRSALLNLNGFYRHIPETKLPPRDCFNG